MIKRLILVLIALVLIFGGIFGWKYKQMQQMAAQMAKPQPPATIASAEVQAETWSPYLFSVGSLVATQGVHVNNEVAGQIRAISFTSGQRVEEGEVLVQLDDSVDRADLEGLIAERRLAELQFKRMERLYKQKSASRADYDEALAKLDRARAQVAAKRAVIAKKKIRAPFAGLLGIRQVDVGEYLAPGSQVVSLQALDPIYLDYSLPEQHIGKLREGQPVELTVQAYEDTVFKGRISALNPGIDPGTRSVRIRATLNNPHGRLRPGMFAEVRTQLPERENVLTVPRTAITYNPYGDSVFVIQEGEGENEGDLIVQRRQVETGNVREGRVEVIAGLEAGERIVRAGHQKLRNGQTVQIDDSVELQEQVARP